MVQRTVLQFGFAAGVLCLAASAQPPSPGTKPCTTVISTLPGSTSLNVIVGGRPAYVATLSGITDGVPPVHSTLFASFPSCSTRVDVVHVQPLPGHFGPA